MDHRRGRLRERSDDDLVDVHVRGPRDNPRDAVRDVFCNQRLEPFLRFAGGILVSVEADHRELRFDEAWVHLGNADRLPE